MTLSVALREAARRIETGEVSYSWMNIARCNCGVLAQVLLGFDSKELEWRIFQGRGFFGFSGTWGRNLEIEAQCKATGLPLHEVLRSLIAAGLSTLDMAHLEGLSAYAIRCRAGLPSTDLFGDYSEAPNVIRYMRAWADMLDEQSATNTLDTNTDDARQLALAMA